MQAIDLFANNWIAKDIMIPIPQQDVDELERQLNAELPESYKYLLITYGLIHTPNVLTKTCDLSVNINNVQDFLSLDDVNSLSKLYQMSGMPEGYVLFASDSAGSMYCFKLSDCHIKQSDVPVWYFNQYTGTVTQINNSFIEWLNNFNTP